MPYKIANDNGRLLLVAYETVSFDTPDPLPTIYAHLIAGWVCPECDAVLRAIAGPWNDIGWYRYDNKIRAHASNGDVRPMASSNMPRYRGDFNSNGGYLYRFDHARPLWKSTAITGYRSHCQTSVSLRLGIVGGVSALPSISDQAREQLTAALSSDTQFTDIGLIPDIAGYRDPIIFTTAHAADLCRDGFVRAYDEPKKKEAWDSFVSVLLARKNGP